MTTTTMTTTTTTVVPSTTTHVQAPPTTSPPDPDAPTTTPEPPTTVTPPPMLQLTDEDSGGRYTVPIGTEIIAPLAAPSVVVSPGEANDLHGWSTQGVWCSANSGVPTGPSDALRLEASQLDAQGTLTIDCIAVGVGEGEVGAQQPCGGTGCAPAFWIVHVTVEGQ